MLKEKLYNNIPRLFLFTEGFTDRTTECSKQSHPKKFYRAYSNLLCSLHYNKITAKKFIEYLARIKKYVQTLEGFIIIFQCPWNENFSTLKFHGLYHLVKNIKQFGDISCLESSLSSISAPVYNNSFGIFHDAGIQL